MSDTAPRKKICLECHRYPCACDTAPQPPPVPTESEQFDMHLRQSTKKDGVEIEAVMRANNRGFRADIWAKHPEFTQWIGEIVSEVFSDHGAVNFLTFEATSPKIGRFEITIQRAEGETTAQRMGRDQARIAALEAQLAAVQQANVMARDIANQANQRAEKAERELAEAQERLSMAVEALKESDRRIWEHHEVGHIERAAHRAWGKACEICSKESPTIFARNQAVLDATSACVAQHTASVERRGAAKELRDLAQELRDGARVIPCPPGAHEWRVTYADELCARAAELEGA